ncbi:MAG: type II toxin-antitoxin system VapC family toxin [Ruminiclostridium sp.]|nr:type II toxin-antitoxin system VapC family toxin [Ruminiclostridium sp.]
MNGTVIAGHALAKSDKLITRDRGFYRTCFAELKIEPGA